MRTHAPRRLYTTEEGSRSGLSYTRQTPGEVQCQYGVSLSRYMSLLIPSLAWYDIIDTIHAKLDEGGR
jgi:hypothetical protein